MPTTGQAEKSKITSLNALRPSIWQYGTGPINTSRNQKRLAGRDDGDPDPVLAAHINELREKIEWLYGHKHYHQDSWKQKGSGRSGSDTRTTTSINYSSNLKLQQTAISDPFWTTGSSDTNPTTLRKRVRAEVDELKASDLNEIRAGIEDMFLHHHSYTDQRYRTDGRTKTSYRNTDPSNIIYSKNLSSATVDLWTEGGALSQGGQKRLTNSDVAKADHINELRFRMERLYYHSHNYYDNKGSSSPVPLPPVI